MITRLFVPFRDGTTGLETYPGGRYLDLDRTPSGIYDLDFNRAYHPNCVFNIEWECPVPPRENRLPVAIRVGEKLSSHGAGEMTDPRLELQALLAEEPVDLARAALSIARLEFPHLDTAARSPHSSGSAAAPPGVFGRLATRPCGCASRRSTGSCTRTNISPAIAGTTTTSATACSTS